MSLMLRKECAEILTDASLGEYHVDIDNKRLKIANPCGATLLFVPGINFNRAQPTQAEISFTKELLQEWLNKNKSIIQRYLAAREQLEANPAPEPNSTIWYSLNYNCSIIVAIDGYKLTYNPKGEVIGVSGTCNSQTPWPKLKPLKFTKAQEKEIAEFFAQHSKHTSAQQAVDEIRQDLNSCCTLV